MDDEERGGNGKRDARDRIAKIMAGESRSGEQLLQEACARAGLPTDLPPERALTLLGMAYAQILLAQPVKRKRGRPIGKLAKHNAFVIAFLDDPELIASGASDAESFKYLLERGLLPKDVNGPDDPDGKAIEAARRSVGRRRKSSTRRPDRK